MADNDAISDPEVLDEIANYLNWEIEKRDEEVAEFLGYVEKWRRQREARPEEETKNYPFDKASNVVTTTALTITQNIFAALKAMFGQKKPFWKVESEKKEFNSHAKALTNLLNVLVESKYHIDLRNKNNTIFYDLVSLGNQFVKVPYLTEKWTYKKTNDSGETEKVEQVLHDGPAVLPIRIEDFYTRGYVTNLQKAKWIGIRWTYEFHELKQLEQQGFFANVDLIDVSDKYQSEDNLLEDEERSGITRTRPDEQYKIFEAYVYWDMDGDGIAEDVKIWFEMETLTVLRAEYNNLGFRDIVHLKYVPRPYQLYAIGVGWICEHAQDEIDCLHNQRIDSTHMAMMQGAIVRKGAGLDDMKIQPAFVWPVDDVADVAFVKIPEITNNSLNAEMLSQQMVEKAAGSKDAMMGYPDQYAKTRSTASGTMFQAQQASTLFDALAENSEAGYREIGLYTVLQLIHNRDNFNLDILCEEDKVLVNEILLMDAKNLHLTFSFKLNVTEIDQTDEAQKQSLMMLVQLYDMYIQKLIQMSMMLSNPQIPPLVKKITIQAIDNVNKLMENIFEKFNQPKEDLVIVMREIELMSDMLKTMGGNYGMEERPGQGSMGRVGQPVGNRGIEEGPENVPVNQAERVE